MTADPRRRSTAPVDPLRHPDAELATTVVDDFTVCFVGDCLISRPITPFALRDRGFRRLLELLASADVTVGNLETPLLDVRSFTGHPYAWEGDWPLLGSPDAADDLARMNIRLVSRANNHALDWGQEGLRQTSEALDAAGVVHAGTGHHAAGARAARFLETDRGRVGLTSMATTFAPFSDALDPHGEAPGRPGVSAVHLSDTLVLPESLFDAASAVAVSVPGPDGDAALRNLFGCSVESSASARRGHHVYEPDHEDLWEVLRAIRLGKQHSDFLVSALHAHEAEDHARLSPTASVVGDLARAAIDSGADAFVTTGIHHLSPVEVYRGRPIFRGLGNFIWSDIQGPLPADLYRLNRELLASSFEVPENVVDADLSATLNARDYAHAEVFESVVARCTFVAGQLADFELHPVDLRHGSTLTSSGIPRLAGPAQGHKIIDRLSVMSAPLGTEITWDGSVGRVRC